ncbi:hypothetical protein CSB09_01035 [Candidatus Gracilibacteria bacterium]|nr:MAG: hypothetical protein CSB09_01035 [Candidatus Gracilibacteria bacterium]
MVYIAFQIKNFFIAIAIIFLIIGVLTLLFSEMDANAAKKWKNNIIWVSLGIIIMQIAFGAWNTLLIGSSEASTTIGSALSWNFWSSVLAPLVRMIQMFAGFVFIVMMIYAFYVIITSAGDESGRKKGINMVIYSVIGFILLRIPDIIVSSFYTNLRDCSGETFGFINPCTGSKGSDFSKIIGAVGNIIQWINGMLAVVCVILVLYAGFLILSSRGEEEKLKKAKKIIIYIAIGLALLLLSHAIFRFFILK